MGATCHKLEAMTAIKAKVNGQTEEAAAEEEQSRDCRIAPQQNPFEVLESRGFRAFFAWRLVHLGARSFRSGEGLLGGIIWRVTETDAPL